MFAALMMGLLGRGAVAQSALARLAADDRHDDVLVEADRLLHELHEDSVSARLDALLAKGIAHYRLKDETHATETMQEALTLARTIPDTAGMLRAMRLLSELLFDGNRFEDALRMERDIFRMASGWHDAGFLVNAHNNLANRFLMVEQRDSAEYYYRAGLARVPPDDRYGRAVFEANIGKLLSERGAHQEAIDMLHAAVADMRAVDHPKLHKAVNGLAYVYHNAGRHREAIEAFTEAEALNQRSEEDIFTTMENLGFTAESQAALGDHKSAYETMLTLEELLHDYYSRTANEEILELEERFETKLKEEEIERLDAENREQYALIRARDLMLYGSLLMLVLALVAAALLWRNFRQKRRHAEVLERLNSELKGQKAHIEEINRLLQLKVLRTQMNPHFIYNCLNAIANLVRKGDAVGATSYLDGFARLLRMVLDHSVKDRVPISEELVFLRQYLKLEALRFPDGLHYEVDADRDLLDEDVPVPTLLVQPFVENAIWHGLANKEGEKRLSVRFEEHGDNLRCVVEDNGVGRRAAPKRAHSDGSPSVGLQLTNERLQLLSFKLNGNSDRLRFHDLTQPDGTPVGTRVELVLG